MSYPGNTRDYVDPQQRPGHGRVTEFAEVVTGSRISDVSLLPQWGASELRNIETITGGGSITSLEGELVVSVSAAASDVTVLDSAARVSYVPGSLGEAGLGIRLTALPVNDQEARWGIFDDNSGTGFGVDATGVFVFSRRNGTETKIYQSSWDLDVADGTGPSGRTLDLTDGNVFQLEWVWYGYGAIVYTIYLPGDNSRERVAVQSTVPQGATTIEDPNQALRIEVRNGASGGAFDVYVGGRQFSFYGGEQARRARRAFEEPVYATALAANPAWTPVLAIRRKATFNGRPNSVRAFVEGVEALAADSMEFRISVNATVNGGSWVAPAEVPAAETALEVQATPTVSAVGIVVAPRLFLSATRGSATGRLIETENLEIGGTSEVVLWARPFSGTPTITAASLKWSEQW